MIAAAEFIQYPESILTYSKEEYNGKRRRLTHVL